MNAGKITDCKYQLANRRRLKGKFNLKWLFIAVNSLNDDDNRDQGDVTVVFKCVIGKFGDFLIEVSLNEFCAGLSNSIIWVCALW